MGGDEGAQGGSGKNNGDFAILRDSKKNNNRNNQTMAPQTQDETKQAPPFTHLIVPYFINSNGTIKRPEHLIAWWSRIFSFYVPEHNFKKKNSLLS